MSMATHKFKTHLRRGFLTRPGEINPGRIDVLDCYKWRQQDLNRRPSMAVSFWSVLGLYLLGCFHVLICT